ncbi:hypothetical protein HRR83_008122 [Exophiala dermatitidis]|uniref:Uncharacterized protein n=1 Tax=Exophiala dermatitidis TaxID=5970 RepID=A0AAN6ERP6_EXODE|nr:hypothetical protein HRR74_008872 [Exophiala dermatitidis]KAJ4513552.1 hypothetical protein HRR73_005710 [Exophiala dermatitidis]KAJ4535670.1 hypothetical protein HRR77_007618 [Exophiala dermatitidis]KAJ4544531.1 hypothetical protein HRR76_002587 [Exophiala dermatitidis]KAJ4570132.1 hypothetical protein HRR82_007695 [Exophiala dermatitidis]
MVGLASNQYSLNNNSYPEHDSSEPLTVGLAYSKCSSLGRVRSNSSPWIIVIKFSVPIEVVKRQTALKGDREIGIGTEVQCQQPGQRWTKKLIAASGLEARRRPSCSQRRTIGAQSQEAQVG